MCAIKMNLLFLLGMALIGVGCSNKTNFIPIPQAEKPLTTDVVYENFFKVNPSEIQFLQPNLEENKTTISFQVKNSSGQLDAPLSAQDLQVFENGIEVTDFNLTKNSTTTVQTVDILFAIDVTGSMATTIESAKTKIIEFIRHTRDAGYHTRMCLSTFGDYTVKKCDRFYDNDPSKPNTEAQVLELISEITKLKALTGVNDPGGHDFDENPMRALIDAAAAPWDDHSQRFTILVTDAGFLYSPGNSGAIGKLAPEFKEVAAAIATSRMKIFAVTPSLAGYDKKFGASEGVVPLSQGEWFKYADLVSGKITMNTILNRILTTVNTTFFLGYTLNSQSHLDPSRPLSERQITVRLKDATLGEMLSISIQSNLPNGREPDPISFKISDRKIRASGLKVWINGVRLTKGYLVTDQGELVFDQPQKALSKIRVVYEYASLKDGIVVEPIILVLNSKIQGLDLKITLNGLDLEPDDVEFRKTTDGKLSVILSERIYAEFDPYQIHENGGLSIAIKHTHQN